MKYILKYHLLLILIFLLSGCLGVPVKRMATQAVPVEIQSTLSNIITQSMTECNPVLLQPWLGKDVRMKNNYGKEAYTEWEILSDLTLFFEEHLYSNFEIAYQVTSTDKESEFIAGKYTDTEKNIYNINMHAKEGRIYKINISKAPLHVPSACDFFNCSLETI